MNVIGGLILKSAEGWKNNKHKVARKIGDIDEDVFKSTKTRMHSIV